MRRKFLVPLILGTLVSNLAFAQANQVERAPRVDPRYGNPKSSFQDDDVADEGVSTSVNELRNCNEEMQVKSLRSAVAQAEELINDTEKVIRADECKYFENFVLEGVPVEPLKQALKYYKDNKSKFKNKNYISIADYSQHSSQKRFYLLDLRTGEVKNFRVSHGSGKTNGVSYGDPDHDGMINQCKFTKDQLTKINSVRKKNGQSPIHDRWAMTRPGFYSTAYLANSVAHDPENKSASAPWPMFSTRPRLNKMILNGLTPSVNDDALRNGVVMHEAFYNQDSSRMGRSFGCPAFQPGEGKEIVNKIQGGSLFYSYVPDCPDDMNKVEKQVSDWDRMCS
ncbi:L,D-transpeptidase catalytic domain protein [Bacteriovorax sp. BSW11_IV]|uniref:murein L,D-transpeptidase catalytic domain-containing protein n=1 Tax=Bacteriovorax sp. BSW11_IV TaxID=1353529 RepID=UPI00038A2A98|nr:murein L,D-transpeptidase catalytic domain family protein [Bacteriovorax sp. BSW11_IV]EQC48454.1 L,D-transpeptidase catalytic domain protein [Bacteriovorax sp. BSW11_IV]